MNHVLSHVPNLIQHCFRIGSGSHIIRMIDNKNIDAETGSA